MTSNVSVRSTRFGGDTLPVMVMAMIAVTEARMDEKKLTFPLY